jgi:pSer/pThr/pTyr-binding forkhead associated (FHA) protein
MTTTNPPTGRTIVRELLKEMEERLYPLMYRTLPPGVFHVYLHPDDHQAIASITSLIVADAEQGLTTRVDELNRRSRLLTFIAGTAAPIEIPAGGWRVYVQPELNGDIGRGDFKIESRLSLPVAPTYNDGAPTVRIGRTTVRGTTRQTVVVDEPAPPADVTSIPIPPRTVAEGSSALPVRAPEAPTAAIEKPQTPRTDETTAGAPSGYAQLTYEDEQGPHTFVVKKDLIAVGRGGSAHWVDVQVVSTPRVSRVHCRIRRDDSGRFFLQDLSTWGTSVDGRRVPSFLRQADGKVEETGDEIELAAGARIQLADAVTVEFQTVDLRRGEPC